jgi:hypothetical protein
VHHTHKDSIMVAASSLMGSSGGGGCVCTVLLLLLLLDGGAVTGCFAKRSDADGHWVLPPCAGTGNRHCPLGQRSDGPSIGNGDLGAMIGGGAGGSTGLSFWLTKNDFWDLAIEARDPLCRYGTYSHKLYVPNMSLDTGCTINNGSGTRNSQGTAGGVLIGPADGQNITSSGWTATQHIGNATVTGQFTLSGGGTLRTESFIAAPASAVTAQLSFLVTRVTASAPVSLNVSTGSCMPPGARCGANTWCEHFQQQYS